tara:strand:+ start:98 stop:754 length:657 start_codon:yes stop_codon:yes gene_type:complete
MDVAREVVDLRKDELAIRERIFWAIVEDDVAKLVPLLEKHELRPDTAFKSYFDHQDSEFSPEMDAAYCGSLKCIAELRKRGSRFKSGLYLNPYEFDLSHNYIATSPPHGDSAPYDDESDSGDGLMSRLSWTDYPDDTVDDYMFYKRLTAKAVSPRVVALAIHGHDSDTIRAIRGEHAQLRVGFDAFYYRALRKSFAPEGAASKRARENYAKEFDGESE